MKNMEVFCMIRIAVVDDNEIYAYDLRKDIEKLFCEKDILCEVLSYTDPEKFITDHYENSFDLIYLDIDMPKINGIELAAMVRKSKTETYLVFVSSYSNFVFKVFQYDAKRFIRRKKLKEELPESIDAYCQDVYYKKELIEMKFENNITEIMDIRKMAYFYSLRHDIFLLFDMQSKRLANRIYTMDVLEGIMKPHGFIRIHKTYLVNYRFIHQIHDDTVILNCVLKNAVLPLSARRYSQVKEQYKLFMRGTDAL